MSKNECNLEKIDLSKPISVLWLGNGLNRTFEGDSWERLILDAKKRRNNNTPIEEIYKLPANMQIIAATTDNVDEEMAAISGYLKKQGSDKNLQKFIRKYVLSQNFSTIISTNYTYEIEKSIDNNYSLFPANSCRKVSERIKQTQRSSMIYCFNQLEYESKNINIWHIHGEACTPSTMVMGNYYYGKRLCDISHYVSSRMSYLKVAYKNKAKIEPKSWIDYFMLGNVYVCGFGMEMSELDFWWLVCCKKRNFPDTNIFVYEPKLKSGLKIMLNAYDIEYRMNYENVECYKEYHKNVFLQIKDAIRKG